MAHRIESSFKQNKAEARSRRMGKLWRRSVLAVLTLLTLGGGGFFYSTLDQWSFGSLDENLVAIDANLEADPLLAENLSDDVPLEPAFVAPNIDLAGDPLILNNETSVGPHSRLQNVKRPDNLASATKAVEVVLLSDRMVSSSTRFMTTLPSSQEDFALFEAQRAAPADYRTVEGPPISSDPSANDLADVETESADLVPVNVDPDELDGLDSGSDGGVESAGWGAALDGNTIAYSEENNDTRFGSSTGEIYVEAERFRTAEDVFVRVLHERSIAEVFIDNGVTTKDAQTSAKEAENVFGVSKLAKGSVVAMRLQRQSRNGPRVIMQVSAYLGDRYLGTLVRSDVGQLRVGADPWVRDDLFSYVDEDDTVRSDRKYRLLDAVYSTAVRNAVPTGIVGEAIRLVSKANDLNAFAQVDDRLVLLYTRGNENSGVGRVLYVAIIGPNRAIHCYVLEIDAGRFGCGKEFGEVEQTIVNGLTTPVRGNLTSRFGPRTHPIHKTVRLHAGVDWAAPSGTPIVAAFDGKVSFVGVAGGYGNMVRLAHSGRRETRYAHMSRFSRAAKVGNRVNAGDVIGYVGTTGLSTGPHLHFELRVNGKPVDPLEVRTASLGGSASVAVAAGVTTGGQAVGRFIDAIIRIESGGNPRAKNPLSSASGLGQFINSTWMRMIRKYRPALLNRMSKQQILDLRFEPTIAREMLLHLTRETAVFLRRRGHGVTPGRLYLGHFLGPGDANRILRTPGNVPLSSVLSSGVMRANPFLRGWTVAKIQNWAERKMAGRKGRKRIPRITAPVANKTETRRIKRRNKEYAEYKAAIDALIAAAGQAS